MVWYGSDGSSNSTLHLHEFCIFLQAGTKFRLSARINSVISALRESLISKTHFTNIFSSQKVLSASHLTLQPILTRSAPDAITTIKMSSTQELIKAIQVIIKEISALPPVKDVKTVKPRQLVKPARPERPAPALTSGWGNFEATIKANDKATFEDRQAQAAAFAASGQEQYTITETFKESNF